MTHLPGRARRRLALAAPALILLALAGAADPAQAATPLRGAFTYVGNVDDGSRSGVVDRRTFRSGASGTLQTALDSGDDMTAGDVLGDAFDEVVVGDDGTGRIDLHDTARGTSTSFSTRIGQDVTLYDDAADDIATGNLAGDSKDEVIVASTRFHMIIVYSATGEELKRLGNLSFDAGDRVVAGDFMPGKGQEELAIVNNEDEGRIDVLDADRNTLQVRHSGYDGDGDDVAAGDDTGDGVEEVIVANDEGGRIESVDFATGKTHSTFTGYDSDDHLGAGDLTGDGNADVVIANTEDNRVDVIDFFGDEDGTFSSAYDSDDRFAVGSFGSGDLDGDGIPDRTELVGIRDDAGQQRFNLKARGAHPCRKDVVVEIDHMTGHAPDKVALENAVATFAAAKEVTPVKDCPYPGKAATATGIRLIIEDLDPAQQEQVPHQAKVTGFKAVAKLIDKHSGYKLPFVRYSLWMDDYETDDGDSPVGQAGHGPFGLDFVLALDGKTDQDVHESTFVHELGHSLGLDHGGATDDLVNCKPNYLSVMNYSFRGGVPKAAGGFAMDFSHQALDMLDEAHLREGAGIGGPAEFKTAWTNGKGIIDEAGADESMDWDGDGPIDADEVPVDLNLKDPLGAAGATCENPNDNQVGLQKLAGHNDWELLNRSLAGRGTVESGETEPTVAQMVQAMAARNQLFFPDSAVAIRPPLPGKSGDVLGVALDADHVYALHNYRKGVDGVFSAVDGPGVLAVLDRATLQVESRITVGLDARSVAVNPVTRRAYVVNRGTGTGSSLAVVNLVTRTVIKEIPLGQVAIDVAVNTRLNRVYVTNPFQEKLLVVDGFTNALLAPVQVGKGLVGLTVDEASNVIYVAMTHRSSEPSFTALGRVKDTGATRVVLPQIDLGVPAVQANDVTVDPKRGRVYVGGLGGGGEAPSVTVLDIATGQQITRLPVPGPVRAISANPQAGLVFAAGDRGVVVIDADALEVIRQIDAGLPFSVTTENGHARQLYVGDVRDGQMRRLSYESSVEK